MSEVVSTTTTSTGQGDTTTFLYAASTTTVQALGDATAAQAAGAETTAATSSLAASLKFPSDLDEYGQWMRIEIFSYSRANRFTNTARQGPSKGTIVLPIPASLAVGYTAQHVAEDLGIGAFAAAGAVAAGKTALDAMQSGKTQEQKITSIAEAVKAGIAGALKNAPGMISGLMLDKFGDASQGASLATGLARNPHTAVLFKGVDLRQHAFEFTFIPRNTGETQTLRDIIQMFKVAMHPSYETGTENHLFKYPDEFQIEFANSQYLYRFQPCVLRTFTVDYTGAGAAAFHSNKAPVALKLNLGFMETAIVTRDDAGRGL